MGHEDNPGPCSLREGPQPRRRTKQERSSETSQPVTFTPTPLTTPEQGADRVPSKALRRLRGWSVEERKAADQHFNAPGSGGLPTLKGTSGSRSGPAGSRGEPAGDDPSTRVCQRTRPNIPSSDRGSAARERTGVPFCSTGPNDFQWRR